MGLTRKLKRGTGTKLGLLIGSVDDEVNRLTLPAFANEPRNLDFAAQDLQRQVHLDWGRCSAGPD